VQFIFQTYMPRGFLRYTIPPYTTDWKGLVCNKKDLYVRIWQLRFILYHRFFVWYGWYSYVVLVVYGYYRKYTKQYCCNVWNKVFYCNLGSGKFFPNNIHRANYHITHSKKQKKPDNTTVLPLGGIVYRKNLVCLYVLPKTQASYPLLSSLCLGPFCIISHEWDKLLICKTDGRIMYVHTSYSYILACCFPITGLHPRCQRSHPQPQ
jgi:hypothetical protein